MDPLTQFQAARNALRPQEARVFRFQSQDRIKLNDLNIESSGSFHSAMSALVRFEF